MDDVDGPRGIAAQWWGKGGIERGGIRLIGHPGMGGGAVVSTCSGTVAGGSGRDGSTPGTDG